MKVKSKSEDAQSYLTFSDPMYCSLPGSSVRGIFQAKVLEWGAIAFLLTIFQKHSKSPLFYETLSENQDHMIIHLVDWFDWLIIWLKGIKLVKG